MRTVYQNTNEQNTTLQNEVSRPVPEAGKQLKKYGNQTTFQCKLTVGAPHDPYEKEADAVADNVMRMPEQNFIQRKCAHCEEEEKKEIQRKPISQNGSARIQAKVETGSSASNSLSNRISSSKGSGGSMDGNTQSFMLSRFGTDFSNVKIHTDGEAIQMNQELNAKAFTVGNDIYFNENQYQPHSDNGKRLLAHELTHSIQQGNDRTIRRKRVCNPLTDSNDIRKELCIGITRGDEGDERFEFDSRQKRWLSAVKSSANRVISRALLAFSARDRYIETLADQIFGAGTMRQHSYSFFENKIIQIRDMLNNATIVGGTCYDYDCYSPGVIAHAIPESNTIVLCYAFFRLCPDEMRRMLIHEAAHNVGIDAARVANFDPESYCREDTSLCSEVCDNLSDRLNNVDALSHFIECVSFSF